MTRAQFTAIRRTVRTLSRHRSPIDQHEAATWAMHEAVALGLSPSLDDHRAFRAIAASIY
jgi:hypothetical protein